MRTRRPSHMSWVFVSKIDGNKFASNANLCSSVIGIGDPSTNRGFSSCCLSTSKSAITNKSVPTDRLSLVGSL
ncbi:MAG: hypothetical protein OXB90_08665, partial [Acidimicrobiaceae bacterium]|nr:hypothetical protein [Acidimicrobiaceae bacterium]